MLWQSSTITLATVFVAPSFFVAVNADLGFPIRIGRICNDNWAGGDKREDPMAYPVSKKVTDGAGGTPEASSKPINLMIRPSRTTGLPGVDLKIGQS